MTTQELLRARFDTVIRRLEQAEQAVLSAGLNARLNKRIGASLAGRLSAELATIRGRNKMLATDKIPSMVWNAISNTKDIDLLLDECLSFLQAARSRGTDVSADLCEITDLLFEELAQKMTSTAWRSYSTFSSEDSFDLKTDIVRLRFPLCDAWDLPVTVHEFGHFMSPRLLQKSGPGSASLVFQQYKVNSEAARKQALAQNASATAAGSEGINWLIYLDEIFADMFATYALGPVFACTCIALRFDPMSAQVEADGLHPSYARRAYIILQTLRRMDNELPDRNRMKAAAAALESHWKGLCEAAGTSHFPSDADRQWIDTHVSNIYSILLSSEPALRFGAWTAAAGKESWLSDPPAHKGEGLSIAELLNTVWIARMKPSCDPQQLNRSFIELCQEKTKSYGQ